MRTEHAGFASPTDIVALRRQMLPVMTRLKIAKTVPEREIILSKALSGTDFADPHWPEGLASRLTEHGVREAADAHLLALVALREADPAGLSRICLEITPEHPLVQAFMQGMSSASPEFIEKIRKGDMDGDQISFRCWMMHIFRRDTANVFQVFLIDAMARKFLGATRLSIVAMVKEIQSRVDDHPAPADAWGYAILIMGVNAFTGLYLKEPDATTAATLERILPQIRAGLADTSDMAIANALVAAGASAALDGHPASTMEVLFRAAASFTGQRFFAVYIRQLEGEALTRLIPIEATSVEEARRKARKMPEIYLQEILREGMEAMAQDEVDMGRKN